MKDDKTHIDFPSGWDEVTEDDWREAARLHQRLLSEGVRQGLTPQAVVTATVMRWLKVRGIRPRPNDGRYLKLVTRLLETMDWVWTMDDGRLMLNYGTTRQLLPRVGDWTGPASHGADLTFGEFRQAMAHLRTWEQDANDTALCALAGLLYRPSDAGGRTAFDADGLDAKIRRGRSMEPWQRWTAYAWLAHFCQYLTTGTFIMEGQEVCFAPLFSGGSSKDKGGGTLAQVGMTVAETGVFGTLRDVEHTLLLDVMQKLLLDYQRLKALRAK